VVQLRSGGQDAAEMLATVDQLVNAVLLAVAGMSVLRETGRVSLAAAAGLLAGFLDAIVIAVANNINPPPDAGDPSRLLLWNIAQGPVLAGAAAWVSSLARRRSGG
jgi:hypothetical protein